METAEFTGFPKMARLSREMIITEKIDGTNAQVFIGESGEFLVGSRTKWITPDNDNHGFAAWAYDNKQEILKLGPGRHFGEWWGFGIQRGYGLPKGEKRFSLFNTQRWCLFGTEPKQLPRSADPKEPIRYQNVLPKCIGLVPILDTGIFDTESVNEVLWHLVVSGSQAAPGFMKPEGIVIFHTAANMCFKKTIDKDEQPKSLNK